MLRRLKDTLRIYGWWDSQFVLMLALIYDRLILSTPIPALKTAIPMLGLFLLASIGMVCFGNLLNDLFDLQQDRRDLSASTKNRYSLRMISRVIFVILTSYLPWRWLPTNAAIGLFLTLEYGLLIACFVPPIRLKERGLLGPSVESLTGYTFPTIIALLVFSRLGNVPVSLWFTAILGTWTFVMGLRVILLNQLGYVAKDEITGTKTYVTTQGWRQVFTFTERVLLPLEASGFLLFLLTLGAHALLAPTGFIVYGIRAAVMHRNYGIWQEINPLRLPVIDKLYFLNIIIMSSFQTCWLPLLLLLRLVMRSPIYLVIAAIHLLLFENGVHIFVCNELPELLRLRRIRSAI